jgi:hypothetical protein
MANSAVITQLASARHLNAEFDHLKSPIPQIINYILTTPIRIYIGMSVSVWSIVATIYQILAPRWRNAKLAPHKLMIGLEIFTIILWFCALVALALFAAEVEPICLLFDEVPILKEVIENCVMVNAAAVFAALSWSVYLCSLASTATDFFSDRLLWLITCITLVVQSCRSQRYKKAKTAANGQAAGTLGYWEPMEQGVSKAGQWVSVTTLEMQPHGV